MKNILKGSDKQFWHRFIPVYDTEFNKLTECNKILEFGVFRGDSVRWLNEKFPKAKIYACDILSIQPEWPIAENIEYFYVDQGSTRTIKKMFSAIDEKLDLIIEDGSHLPEHQKNCLVESINHLRSGGMYILEDLHTLHPEHSFYQKKGKKYISAFHLLLCFEHLISNRMELDKSTLKKISKKSLFKKSEVQFLFQKISEIKLFKRATLPHRCYKCGSQDFNYHELKCTCGVGIYSFADSITAVITLK